MRYSFKMLGKDSGPEAESVIECRDLPAARCQAIHLAAKHLLREPSWAGDEMRVEIEDDQGRQAATVIVLAIDTKNEGETIHISRRAATDEDNEPLFASGSGRAWRKQRNQNT